MRSDYRKNNRPRIETIKMYIVLKFQFGHACFLKGEATANFCVSIHICICISNADTINIQLRVINSRPYLLAGA